MDKQRIKCTRCGRRITVIGVKKETFLCPTAPPRNGGKTRRYRGIATRLRISDCGGRRTTNENTLNAKDIIYGAVE